MSQPAPYSILEQLVKKLQEKNISQEKIAGVLEDINALASSQFYTSLLESFTKEEITQINDDTKTQEEAHEMIAKLYKERTGEEASTVKQELIETLASEYLKESDTIPVNPA